MPNQNVAQGTLNRLRASVVIPAIPSLNIVAANLDKEAIGLAFTGDSTVYIDTLTGAVTSPEPYLRAAVKCHLLKTQPLANAFKLQMETLATIGDLTVIPDASTLSNYQLTNCSIMSVDELMFNGQVAGYVVNLGGVYQINQALWDQG